jgi:pimeloyl-ACP methyl ester carboxylesterase
MTMTIRTSHLHRPAGRRVAVYDLTPDAPAEAPVVLLCHAAPGAGGFDPDPAATAARGVRLLGLDRPGYGGSDPAGERLATVAEAAGDAAAVLEAALPAGATAGVAGWSAGGRVALALAARRPDLVDRVAVVATPAPDEAVPWIPAEHRAGIEALRGAPAPVVHAALAEAFGPMLGLTGDERLGLVGIGDTDAPVLAESGVRERVAAMLDAAFAQGAGGMVSDVAGYSLAPWGFTPGEVAAPALLVFGSADEVAGPAHGAWWQRSLPDARLETWPGHGHLVVVPAWERVLAHLVPAR